MLLEFYLINSKVNQELFNKTYELTGITEEVQKPFKSMLKKVKHFRDKSYEVQDSLRIIPSKKSISISVNILELKSKADKDLEYYISHH